MWIPNLLSAIEYGKNQCLNIHLKFSFILLKKPWRGLTDMYWEDLHIYFLVTFHTVSTIAFKGGFICPSLCLRVLHPFFWSFSGQIECICRRLQCILHKERVVLSLFFDWIFLMHARFFRRSPTHFGSIEHLIWHFFFFFKSRTLDRMFQRCVYSINLQKRNILQHQSLFFTLKTESHAFYSHYVVTRCYCMLQWYILTAVF